MKSLWKMRLKMPTEEENRTSNIKTKQPAYRKELNSCHPTFLGKLVGPSGLEIKGRANLCMLGIQIQILTLMPASLDQWDALPHRGSHTFSPQGWSPDFCHSLDPTFSLFKEKSDNLIKCWKGDKKENEEWEGILQSTMKGKPVRCRKAQGIVLQHLKNPSILQEYLSRPDFSTKGLR